MTDKDDIFLVYDSECPICNLHSKKTQIGDEHGRLVLVDARKDSDLMDEISGLGLDIDDGIALKTGARIYHDVDAIHELAKMSSRTGLYNWMLGALFSSRRLAGVLYPPLKVCRMLLLKILRRSRINNLGRDGVDRF
jgi:predicted DCC family thiol-disulfide oxidoreductase YuxK